MLSVNISIFLSMSDVAERLLEECEEDGMEAEELENFLLVCVRFGDEDVVRPYAMERLALLWHTTLDDHVAAIRAMHDVIATPAGNAFKSYARLAWMLAMHAPGVEAKQQAIQLIGRLYNDEDKRYETSLCLAYINFYTFADYTRAWQYCKTAVRMAASWREHRAAVRALQHISHRWHGGDASELDQIHQLSLEDDDDDDDDVSGADDPPEPPWLHCDGMTTSTLALETTWHGDDDEAIRQYERTVSLYPCHPWLLVNFAMFLKAQGRLDACKQFLGRALAIDPELGQAHVLLGHICMSCGHDSQAMTHFETVLRINPRHKAARHNLAVLLDRQGRHEQADQLRTWDDVDPWLEITDDDGDQSTPLFRVM